VSVLVYGLIVGVIASIVQFSALGLADTSGSSYSADDAGFSYSYNVTSLGPASIAILVLGYLVLLVVAAAISSAQYVGLLGIADGQPTTIGSFFKPRYIGPMIVLTLIVGVLVGIGYVLCVIPGLIVALFAMFAHPILVDRNLSPIDSLKASIEIVKANVGQVILVWAGGRLDRRGRHPRLWRRCPGLRSGRLADAGVHLPSPQRWSGRPADAVTPRPVRGTPVAAPEQA